MKLATAAATLALATSAAALSTLNGWKPDATKFCYGLPGSLAPVCDFDPLCCDSNEVGWDNTCIEEGIDECGSICL